MRVWEGEGDPSFRRGTENLVLARIGRWSFTHRWATLGIWLFALFALFALAGGVGARFSDEMSIPESESADGFKVLQKNFGGEAGSLQSGSVVFVAPQGVTDPAVKTAME